VGRQLLPPSLRTRYLKHHLSLGTAWQERSRLSMNFKVRLRLKPELLSSVIAVLHGVIGNNIEVREARRSIQKLLQVKSAALCSFLVVRAVSSLRSAGGGLVSV
jgi:hypothetical protein